ncbi:MAG: MscL family protein [Patescibacteria group bacterium]
MKGFMNFVREQGVVGLAVGLAIGTEAGKAVQALVDGLISPIVGYILGGTDLSSEAWTVTESADRALTIGWGSIVNAIITLLAVAFVIYWVVQRLGLDKLDKKK